MRKFLLITLLAISLVSCQDRAKKNVESSSAIPLNSEITAKADIDFKSNPIAEELGKSWEWNQELKEFKFIKEEAVLVKNNEKI